ncbi:hypothetical protein ACOME3_006994 [Neoechinorhynchus agilis]
MDFSSDSGKNVPVFIFTGEHLYTSRNEVKSGDRKAGEIEDDYEQIAFEVINGSLALIDNDFSGTNHLNHDKCTKVLDSQFILKCFNDEIIKFYEYNKMSYEIFCEKRSIINAVSFITTGAFPGSSLYVCGSMMTGLAKDASDVDLTLQIDNLNELTRSKTIEMLTRIRNALNATHAVTLKRVIPATVPILWFRWTTKQYVNNVDEEYSFDFDLNINSVGSVRNTHLMAAYYACDRRIRPFLFFLKQWACSIDINDPKNHSLSSYALCLLAIHFFQFACDPPVLPCLQRLWPEMFSFSRTCQELAKEHSDLDKIIPDKGWKSQNKQCLGSLFHDFLLYYKDFDYDQIVISVRSGRKYHLSDPEVQEYASKIKLASSFINVEEPLYFYNVGRSVNERRHFDRIIENIEDAFNDLYDKLKNIESEIEMKAKLNRLDLVRFS